MNMKTPNESFHDRIARRYDEIYSSARWARWFEISWAGIKPHIPSDLRAPIVDLGCGTGKYGLRLAKSGYAVTLSDLSRGMLEVCRQKAAVQGLDERVTFVKADVMDLSELPRERFALAIAQGDPISFAAHAPKAVKEISKILRPGGVLVASVDAMLAALDHYAEKSDLDGLELLVKNGEMEWLANDESERFPVHTFTPEKLRALFESAGFEVLDLFGKTILPFKKLEALFENEEASERIMALEKKLCRIPSALGRASHLQIAARKK
ncbi:MAG TPA: methyltransferase domain-containing protein [Planctomycetota bacterium]|nr:methyltransferase domain-containing protein [Planctomycetota bacterium]